MISGSSTGGVGKTDDAHEALRRQIAGGRQAEEIFRRVVEATPNAIVLADAGERILLVNAGAEKLFGYSREEMIGQPVEMLVPERFRATLTGYRSACAVHAEAVPLGKGRELFALRKDGVEVPVEIGLNPIETAEGPLILSAVIDITERKQAEESRVRLAALVNSSDDAIIGKTLDGVITSWNPGAEKVFGYAAAETIGQAMVKLFPPDRAGEEKELLARIGRGESVDHFDTVRVCKNGRHIDVSISLSPITDSEGTVVGASKIARDITDRKRTEDTDRKRTNEALQRQARLLNVSFDAILLWDMEGAIINYWNEGAQEMYGFPPEEAIGRRSYDLLTTHHPLGVEFFKTELRRTGSWTGELQHRTRAGELIVVESRQRLVQEADGQQIVFETNRNITKRKRDEEALRKSEERYRTTLESMMEGCQLIGADWRYLYLNSAASVHNRRPNEELLGRTMTEAWPGIEATGVFALLSRSMAERVAVHEEAEFVFPDGSSGWFDLRSQPIPEGIFVLSIDITERKRVEDEIHRLNAELEGRVKTRTAELETANKELEAFSYSVSHDLRSPLRTVDGFAQMVLEDYGSQLPPEGQCALQTIREGAQRMGVLIDDLLTFSRLSRMPVNKRAIATDKLVRDVLADSAPERKGRKIDYRIGELPPCSGDPALLKQVWINLLSNACKYTRQRAVAVIEVGSLLEKGETVYFVRDNGTGFDMRYAGKLFGVFQRLHRMEDYEGTGVGLAIVHRVIHRHGGRIWVEAAVDRGATFYFTLQGADKL